MRDRFGIGSVRETSVWIGDDMGAPNDNSVNLGLLMEIAQTHQKLAEATLQRLEEYTRGLDAVVRSEIRRTLIDELRGVHVEAKRATDALQRVQRAANVRVALWSLLVPILSATAASAAVLLTVHLIMKGH
jgi:hypothetical protein